MLGFLAYMVGTNLMWMGTDWLAKGKLPLALGLWWLLLPLLAFAAWAYLRDGRMRRPRIGRVARGGGGWRRSRRSKTCTSAAWSAAERRVGKEGVSGGQCRLVP